VTGDRFATRHWTLLSDHDFADAYEQPACAAIVEGHEKERSVTGDR
jgi:hypothetical protein